MNQAAQLSAAQQLASSGAGVPNIESSGAAGGDDDDDDIPELEEVQEEGEREGEEGQRAVGHGGGSWLR